MMSAMNIVCASLVPCILLVGCFVGSASAFSPAGTIPMARRQLDQVCLSLAVAQKPAPVSSEMLPCAEFAGELD